MLLAGEADDPHAAASRDEIKAALDHCLGKLAEADRQIVEKRYAEGLRITRIAEELGRNVATLRVQLFRIRQSLLLCVQARLAQRV
jgi:RNA polymerase sigma-70 factor (ECF subfamily)